jgi:hypothetical protein
VLCSVEFFVNSMKVKPAPGRSAEPAVGWHPEPASCAGRGGRDALTCGTA